MTFSVRPQPQKNCGERPSFRYKNAAKREKAQKRLEKRGKERLVFLTRDLKVYLVLSSSLALSLAGNTLLGLLDGGRTGDGLVDLREDNLHVAGVGHEGVDTTVSAVQATADLGGSVDLDVANVQEIGVQVLERSVGLGVLEEIQQELAGLLGPASKGARNVLMLLGLGSAANTSDGATEGDGILVVQDTLKESLGLLKTHSTDGVSGSVGVLEVDTQVGSLSLGRYFHTTNHFGQYSTFISLPLHHIHVHTGSPSTPLHALQI